jgi:phosphoribosyl-ATP pyrophosphohydrolase
VRIGSTGNGEHEHRPPEAGEATGAARERNTEGPAASEESGPAGPVLSQLQAVIRDRHRDMPEGSYTTHLFSKGADKIRKKTGEEAVEVILARSGAELTSEAADLIYHLMVLLESQDLGIQDVVAVLRERHASG